MTHTNELIESVLSDRAVTLSIQRISKERWKLAKMLRVAMKGIMHDGCDGGMRCGGCELEAEIERLAAGENGNA